MNGGWDYRCKMRKNYPLVYSIEVISDMYRWNGIPSGKRLQFAIEQLAMKIVDLSIQNGDYP